MRWLFAGNAEPISVAVRTPWFPVEAHPAVLARFEIGVSDAVAFGERLSGAIRCNVTSHRFDGADHFVSEHLRDTALDFGTVPAPKMQVRAADIRHSDTDEHIVGCNRWNRVFSKFHRCLRLCEDGDFPCFHVFKFPCGSVRWFWVLMFLSVESSQTLFGTSHLCYIGVDVKFPCGDVNFPCGSVPKQRRLVVVPSYFLRG